MAVKYGNTITATGTLANPFKSPMQAHEAGVVSGTYYFLGNGMSSAHQLEYQYNYYESSSWVCVFRSPYNSTATTNKIDFSIPMKGLLVQRDALDIRAAVYWKNAQSYNTVIGTGIDADGGYAYKRVILGTGGGHGIFNTKQESCNWPDSVGAVGAGFDGTTCGSFPDGLIWGSGQSGTSTYTNRSGTWSHWITW